MYVKPGEKYTLDITADSACQMWNITAPKNMTMVYKAYIPNHKGTKRILLVKDIAGSRELEKIWKDPMCFIGTTIGRQFWIQKINSYARGMIQFSAHPKQLGNLA